MTQVRRLGAVAAVLAVAALFAATRVRGGPGKDDEQTRFRRSGTEAARKARPDGLEAELAATKFSNHKVVSYVTKDGDTVVGWQLKPDLPAAPPRPRDLLVLVDTSASQARGPLDAAIKLAEALVKDLGPEDRLALWAV